MYYKFFVKIVVIITAKYFTLENLLLGPFQFPLIGSINQVLKNSSTDVKVVHARYEFYIGSQRFILESDEKNYSIDFKANH